MEKDLRKADLLNLRGIMAAFRLDLAVGVIGKPLSPLFFGKRERKSKHVKDHKSVFIDDKSNQKRKAGNPAC